MQVVGSNLKMTLSHRFEVPSERRNRLGPAAGQAAAMAQSIPLFDLSQVMSRLPNLKTNDYQTGRLASHANQLLAKIGLSGKTPDEAHLSDKQAATVRILEHVFGMPGIKQYGLRLDAAPNNATPSLLSKPFSLWDSLSSGRTLSYDYHESYRESRATTITMNGTVTTDDGRAFAFTLDYKMDPNFQRQADFNKQVSDTSLPNFHKYKSSLPSNSNDPDKSLFYSVSNTPLNHKRAIDLSAHDDDGNGIINDKDAIWNSLRSWTGGDRSPVLLSMWNIDAISMTRIKAPVVNDHIHNQMSEKSISINPYMTNVDKSNSVKHVDVTI